MGQPRIAPAESPEPEATELIGKLTPAGQRPFNIFGTLAHHPSLLRRYVAFGGVFMQFNQLPPREREVVILRTAWLTGSIYEFGQHTRIGGQAGLAEEEIVRLAQPGQEGWSADDALLLQMVDELGGQSRVGDQTWQRLAERFTEAQLLELLALAGFYRMTAGILNSAGVELDPGVAGWPAGTEPSR